MVLAIQLIFRKTTHNLNKGSQIRKIKASIFCFVFDQQQKLDENCSARLLNVANNNLHLEFLGLKTHIHECMSLYVYESFDEPCNLILI